MSALICTEQGKRLHIGIYYSPYWSPICAQPSGDIYLLASGASAVGRNRKACTNCLAVAAEISALDSQLTRAQFAAASTEER